MKKRTDCVHLFILQSVLKVGRLLLTGREEDIDAEHVHGKNRIDDSKAFFSHKGGEAFVRFDEMLAALLGEIVKGGAKAVQSSDAFCDKACATFERDVTCGGGIQEESAGFPSSEIVSIVGFPAITPEEHFLCNKLLTRRLLFLDHIPATEHQKGGGGGSAIARGKAHARVALVFAAAGLADAIPSQNAAMILQRHLPRKHWVDYRSYIWSFIDIHDDDIRSRVQESLNTGRLWPDPLIQFNPSFEKSGSVDTLIAEGILASELRHVFQGVSLYTHQIEAMRMGSKPRSFVVTSGTGSGKSLTYLGSVFNHLFRNGSGKGVQAILVYPMNALINSQVEELKKLAARYEESAGGQFPVRFAAYTGQTRSELRKQILDQPPDILLTNYMMLELLLTRHGERQIRDSIYKSLRFLVFDELHTYRGRQGADVGMLIRRIRGCCNSPLTLIGTSATMASGGTFADQRTAVASVAGKIFGEEVKPDQIIGETLDRSLASSATSPNRGELAAAIACPISMQKDELALQSHTPHTIGIISITGPSWFPAPLSLPAWIWPTVSWLSRTSTPSCSPKSGFRPPDSLLELPTIRGRREFALRYPCRPIV